MLRFRAAALVALSLGLGWAMRGHFGHEWGACWAGAIGALALIVAAGRADWFRRLPTLAALGGIGWAVGGMMSYGLLVGYGLSNDWRTAAYGLAMLFVVGGLYGGIGGGLLGLALETTAERRPDWAELITQMVAGAVLGWGVLIYQFEWCMTPPRSELWAACFGATAAMFWYLGRNGYRRAVRVACFAALGAGFGFALGDVLQRLGVALGWPFNWWNVMEFTLGACGGLGMAVGVLNQSWPVAARPSRRANYLALAFLTLAVPATNILQACSASRLTRLARQLDQANPTAFAAQQQFVAWTALVLFAVVVAFGWQRMERGSTARLRLAASLFLLVYTVWYLFYSHLIKGVFYQPFTQQLEQKLYWVCLAVIVLLMFSGNYAEITPRRSDTSSSANNTSSERT